MDDYPNFRNRRQSEVSSAELRRRLASHQEVVHVEGSITVEECSACKLITKAIKEAEKREKKKK